MRRISILAAGGVLAITGAALAQDTIYGIDNARNVLGTFTSATPNVFTDIGPTGILTNFTNSLEFDGSGGLWASDGFSLFKINPNTGAGTLVGGHGISNGENITDFTWDGSTMWAIGTVCGVQSSIWKINLSTGAATFVCTTDIGGACDVGLVYGADGVFYGHDLVTDSIYKLNTSTCVTTTVVALPFDTNFGQGLTASATTNYHVAFNATAFQGQLWKFDGAGNYNQLGTLQPLQIAAADVGGGGGECLNLQVNTLIAGTTGVWQVSGAIANREVAFVYGLREGTTKISGYADYCATFGIQAVNQSKVLCRKRADANGDATCRKPLPPGVRGVRVLSQVAMKGTCPDECVSNIDDQVIQ